MLADNVLVQNRLDLLRHRQVVLAGLGIGLLDLLPNDVITQVNALVTNEDRGAGYQLPHLMLAFAAEGAVQQLAAIIARLCGVIAHLVTFY